MRRMMIATMVGLLSMFSISMTYGDETSTKIDEFLIEMGQRELARGQYHKALLDFRKALLINPYSEVAQKQVQALEDALRLPDVRQIGHALSDQTSQTIHASNKKCAVFAYQSSMTDAEMGRPWVMDVDGFVDYDDLHPIKQNQTLNQTQQKATEWTQHQRWLSVQDEFLTIREEQLDEARDLQIDREISLVRAGQILRDQTEELEQVTTQHYQLLQMDRKHLAVEKQLLTVQTLEQRLDHSLDRIAQLEQQLYASHKRIQDLLIYHDAFVKDIKQQLYDSK